MAKKRRGVKRHLVHLVIILGVVLVHFFLFLEIKRSGAHDEEGEGGEQEKMRT